MFGCPEGGTARSPREPPSRSRGVDARLAGGKARSGGTENQETYKPKQKSIRKNRNHNFQFLRCQIGTTHTTQAKSESHNLPVSLSRHAHIIATVALFMHLCLKYYIVSACEKCSPCVAPRLFRSGPLVPGTERLQWQGRRVHDTPPRVGAPRVWEWVVPHLSTELASAPRSRAWR